MGGFYFAASVKAVVVWRNIPELIWLVFGNIYNFTCSLYVHRGRKKWANGILYITLPNIDRFTKFIHRHILQEICYTAIMKDPTPPQTHHYTTLWNTNAKNWLNQVIS